MANLAAIQPMETTQPEFEGKGIAAYKRWVRNAEETHSEARKLSHRDRDWYDNYNDGQWDEREKQILLRRGQPIVTMNRIKRKVNFLCGIEQKARSDPKAYARKPQNERQAEVATDVLDYIENAVRFDKVASESFRGMCIEGICAVDVCYEQGSGAEGIDCKEIDFDQFFYDPRSRRRDFSDARYLGYHNWYDLDDALAMFKDSKDAEAALKGSLSGETTDEGADDKPRFRWGDSERQRVRVACVYWKDAEGGWNYTYFSGGGILEEGPSTYLDDKGKTDCPIIAASAYVTRENERYGVVRDMISPQSEMNYRRSMSLFLIKNRRVWASTGVFGPEQNVKEEVARADAVLIANGQFGVEWGFIESQAEIAQNFELLQDAKAEIDAQGPNAGLQGRGVENQSGRAILAQQNAGMAEENTIFDTHNDWKLRVYRAMWSRAKQFWQEPMFIRIADGEAPGGAKFTPVNQPDPEQMQAMMGQPQMPGMPPMGGPPMGQPPMGMPPQGMPMMPGMPGQMPGMQMPEPIDMNMLADMDVDIVIEAAPDMITLQHEEFEKLTMAVQAGVPIPPDVILEASQIRNKKALVDRMKQDGDLNAKLQAAGEQLEQMKSVIASLNRQLLMGTGKDPAQPQGPSPDVMAKAQATMASIQRDDAIAQAQIGKIQADQGRAEAQSFKTVQDAMRPPNQTRP
jgi:hypothetical protein